jgi:hypothetical protein
MAYFPELRGEAQTGKTKMWSIRVFEQEGLGVIETMHGYIDGKKQTNQKIISEGKNIGKRNETTPLQQAINEARTAFIKKRESGYTAVGVSDDTDNACDESAADTVGRGKGITEDVPLPMLAFEYSKRGKSIVFPCFAQPKLDGTRCVAIPGKGLFSRNRKNYPHLEHIIQEINRLPPSLVLDGELYSDTLTFQEIVGLVKRETLKTDDDVKQLQIKFHVYDIINETPYTVRYTNLQHIFRKNKFKYLDLVLTERCDSEEHMKELHNSYVERGYEGVMVRNKDGLYKHARSIDLQKYKVFEDAEYKIVGYTEGQGLENGCVIWTCITPEGKTFSVRPTGSREERQELFIEGDKYIGSMLTVKYQELSDDKVPRFPVGRCIRTWE